MTRAAISTRANPSEPLPSEFHEHDYALMTVGEFMLQRNPDEKFHQSSTWSSDLDSLNRDWLSHLGQSVDDQRRRVIVYGDAERPAENLVFRDHETREVVAVLRDGVLYRTRFRTVPRWYESAGHGREVRNIGIEREQEVKYPAEQTAPPRDRNLADFPVLLRRLVRKGERLELRAERAPRQGRQDGIALLNRDGLVVGRVDDEWGATLLRVAEEYTGAGLGRELLAVWNEYNPDWQSGGFTVQGASTAAAAWSDRVRLFLARGWYTALVRAGRMTSARVRAITSGLPKRRSSAELHGAAAMPEKVDLRVYLDTDVTSFVLYDAQFLADHDERRVLGYGFLRDTPRHSLFFYRLEYEPKYVNLVTRIALQLARENRAPLFVAAAPSDLVPWELVPEALHSDGYVTLSRDVLPLRDLGRLEYLMRRPMDPHRELQDRLLEAAEHKWQ